MKLVKLKRMLFEGIFLLSWHFLELCSTTIALTLEASPRYSKPDHTACLAELFPS